MSETKITLIGLNNYFNNIGQDLFQFLSLPDGIDKDTLTNNILLRGGEFEVLYTDPDFLKQSFEVFSNKWFWTFDKWVKAINISYNPLENYDRFEEWTENINGTSTNNGTVNSSNISTTTDDTDTSSTNTRSAYDSSSYEPHDKNEGTLENTTHVSGEDRTTTSSNGTTTNKNVHTGHIHGNIGVKDNMQMLQSELDVAWFNLYEQITDIFLREYTIPIY